MIRETTPRKMKKIETMTSATFWLVELKKTKDHLLRETTTPFETTARKMKKIETTRSPKKIETARSATFGLVELKRRKVHLIREATPRQMK